MGCPYKFHGLIPYLPSEGGSVHGASPGAFLGYNYGMPPTTVTFTETEAQHIRKLITNHKESLTTWSHSHVIPEWCNSHKTVIELDESLLEKFKDAQ